MVPNGDPDTGVVGDIQKPAVRIDFSAGNSGPNDKRGPLHRRQRPAARINLVGGNIAGVKVFRHRRICRLDRRLLKWDPRVPQRASL
jgi:hypothetical protein